MKLVVANLVLVERVAHLLAQLRRRVKLSLAEGQQIVATAQQVPGSAQAIYPPPPPPPPKIKFWWDCL